MLFADGRWLQVPGGCGTVEAGNEVIYLTMSLRNVGSGIGIVHGWRFYPDWDAGRPRPELGEFHPQTRDIYLPPGDIGFWQAAFRDQDDPRYDEACQQEGSRGARPVLTQGPP